MNVPVSVKNCTTNRHDYCYSSFCTIILPMMYKIDVRDIDLILHYGIYQRFEFLACMFLCHR